MPRALAVVGLTAIAGYFVWIRFSGGFARSSKQVTPWAGALGQGLWLVGLVLAVRLIGMLPAMGLFVIASMRLEGKSHWLKIMMIAIPYWLAAFFLFHELLHLPWPHYFLGVWLPAIRRNRGGLV
jgi:hypothetical protein